ncbi:MAG: FAD-dependent oxidoreductase [Gammaproteobacteria bacterium]|nr:FAD-dependent oxidoreductase [Gammaproteobacteria bacterium]
MAGFDHDIIIVGGGIHGAGCAQAAAAQGYNVLVLEQHALAHGTSSRSSKLIHGGLRYLESGQFALVRECLQERRRLLQNAPGLVHLIPFHIPIYEQTTRRPWQIRSGLALYALLSGLEHSGLFSTVPKRQWAELDGLQTTGLQQVFRYYDAQTDDAALTRAVMQSAISLGAELAMPATFDGAELDDHGCRVRYLHQGRTIRRRGRIMINATGPWAPQVLVRVMPVQPAIPIELVQGTHIVLPGSLVQGCYYMEAPSDRRAIFAMPWRQQTLVGTTETPFHGDPSAIVPLPQEQDYLLQTAGHYFPAYRNLGRGAIQSSFAGLRVLPGGAGTAFGRPRETVMHCDRATNTRLLTLYGGKLTAYRATADKVMQLLRATLPPRPRQADTRMIRLIDSDTYDSPR